MVDMPNQNKFFTEGHLLNLIKSTVKAQLSPAAHVMRKWTTFGVNINLMNFYITFQTCCRTIYFVTELTQITCRLSRKDLCNISLWLFTVKKPHMTSKSNFRQTDPTVQVEKCFKLKSSPVSRWIVPFSILQIFYNHCRSYIYIHLYERYQLM